jgi:hypothetical protein
VVDAKALALFPEIATLLDSGAYVSKYESYPDTVWVRADTATQLP